MKKLIVLSVIFSLVAGSVFAADVSVEVQGGAKLINTSSEEYLYEKENDKAPVYVTDWNGTSFGIGRIRIGASGATEDGTIGGWLRYDAGGDAAGFVFWKPSDLFKLQIGCNPDGEFDLNGVASWGFYQIAGDVGVASESWAFGNSFYGGYGGAGVILTSAPAEGFSINIGIPLVDTKYGKPNESTSDKDKYFYFGSDYAYQNYKKFTLQVKYDIAGLGTAGITYENSSFQHDILTDDDGPVYKEIEGASGFPLQQPNNDNPKLYAYFGLTSIENLGIDVGIGYKFSDSWYEDEVTYTTNNPLAVGIGVNFSSGALGVKARVQGEFAGSYVVADIPIGKDKKTYTVNDGYGLIIDVQPSYAINETLTAYLSTGIAFKTGDEYVEKMDDKGEPVFTANTRSLVNWHVNPYIVITPNYWSGAFFAGIRIDSPSDYYFTKDKDGKTTRNRILNFSIPIGIAVSF